MVSFFSQLLVVAKIWPLKDEPFLCFRGLTIGNFAQKVKDFHLKNLSPPQIMVHCGQKLVGSKIIGIIFIREWEFS